MYNEIPDSLVKTTAFVPAGICKVWFAPNDWILNFKALKDLLSSTATTSYHPFDLTEVTFVDGKGWLYVSSMRDTCVFNQTKEKSAAGEYFKSALQFKINNDVYITVGNSMHSLNRRQCIVVVQFENGTIRIMGAQKRGADFYFDFSSGTPSKDGNVYDCKFQWQSEEPCFYGNSDSIFNPDIEVPVLPSGVYGTVWRDGSGAPSDSVGRNGDYYLDDDTGNVYLKTAGVYSIVANIKGPTGATGAAGLPPLSVIIDNQGSVIPTGSAGFGIVAYTRTITGYKIVNGEGLATGSIVVDIKRAGVSIIGGGNKPTLTTATSATATLSGWTSVVLTANDILEVNVDSASVITKCQIVLI